MITLWPMRSFILSASSRPTKSVGLPAGKAMTMRIGREGKSCAVPGDTAAAPSAANRRIGRALDRLGRGVIAGSLRARIHGRMPHGRGRRQPVLPPLAALRGDPAADAVGPQMRAAGFLVLADAVPPAVGKLPDPVRVRARLSLSRRHRKVDQLAALLAGEVAGVLPGLQQRAAELSISLNSVDGGVDEAAREAAAGPECERNQREYDGCLHAVSRAEVPHRREQPVRSRSAASRTCRTTLPDVATL